MNVEHGDDHEDKWKKIYMSTSEDRDYDDIQVSNKGEMLKFANGKMFHTKFFYIIWREWVK